jgi:NTE family protein
VVRARLAEAMSSSNGSAPKIAVVLPGGGARGGYEAGALSVLLPALQARGEHVSVVCGTSVGAINTAFLGSVAHLPQTEQADIVMRTWRQMRKGDVINPILGPNLPKTALRFVGEILEVPGARLASLLDPSPLEASLERWIDWVALQRNVRTRAVDALCVVATALTRGGPVGFVHSSGAVPKSRPTDDLRYVRVNALGPEHVRASAAIPLLFPPVEVTRPRRAADFYIDGGTRLNSPIAPALALGADRVIVIGFEPFGGRLDGAVKPPLPRLADVAANVLDGLLVDQVADDLHRLAAINSFYVEGSGVAGVSQPARAYRTAAGKKPYKRVSYALVAPQRRGELGAIAEEVFQERYAGWRGWLRPDYPLLSRVLGGGRTRSRGELLSFLLFDEHYVERLIEAGAADAERWLARHPRFWCADAAHDFNVSPDSQEAVREQAALDEWRSLRRR